MNGNKKYVDHPAPSVVMVAILLLVIAGVIATVPGVRGPSNEATPVLFWIVIGSVLVITAFYFWPFYSTYYTVSAEGIEVRYGPWTRRYPWSEFATAYWQKGMFATRIGWPSVTPCVRLTNAVLLKRRAKGFGLYLTPNDPRAFLQRITEFAPELTAEAIL
jgi:hypothetical protein